MPAAWLRLRLAMIDHGAAMIGRGGHDVVGSDALASAEQGKQDQRGDDQDLQDDRDHQSASLDFAGAFFGFGITFDEASTKKIRTLLRSRAVGHHTPPENGPARRGVLRRQSSEVVFGRPAPLSQGCEVRASSAKLDARAEQQVPGIIENH